jgi:hypothetical protein
MPREWDPRVRGEGEGREGGEVPGSMGVRGFEGMEGVGVSKEKVEEMTRKMELVQFGEELSKEWQEEMEEKLSTHLENAARVQVESERSLLAVMRQEMAKQNEQMTQLMKLLLEVKGQAQVEK